MLSQTSYYVAGSGAETGQVEAVLWPNSNNKETFAYDNKGLLASHTRWIAGTSYTMEYDDYDELNRPETLTYPNNETVTITYDHEGEDDIEAGGTTLIASVFYNELGQMTHNNRGNYVRTTYDYAGASGDFRLENSYVRHFYSPSTTDLLDFDYTYDDVGNITHVFEDVSNDSQWFGYDELNRLTSAYTMGGPAPYDHIYIYDALGNLQSRSETIGETAVTYDLIYPTGNNPTQPHATTTVKNGPQTVSSFAYDDNGNMISRVDHVAGKTYTQEFDVENRLITVTLSSGTPMTTTFHYDAGGQRTQTISYDSSTSRTVTQYPFPNYEVERAQSWQYSCSIDPCGYIWVTTQTTTRSTYFMAGQAIATRVNGTLYHLHSDHLGSTSLMTNSSGNSVGNTTARYLPYGGYRTTPTAGLTERGYTGHHENSYIKLIYMNARWYDSQIGRFVSADSIVPQTDNPQAFNRYSYVYSNVLNLVDPSGHCAGDPSEAHSNPDRDCWNLLTELENRWGIDIQDASLWEIFHLQALEFVLNNYAELVGGEGAWRNILSLAASGSDRDKFVVRGQLLDWAANGECTTGCYDKGEIRFDLSKTFSNVPPAAGLFDNNNSAEYDAARIIIAHEFAHPLYEQLLPSSLQSDYMNARGWYLDDNQKWKAANGALTLFDDPGHHLVHITGLYVAGGNTWNLVPAQNKTRTGPIPYGDRQFVRNVGFYVP